MQRKLARENAFLLIFESVCKSDEDNQEIFDKLEKEFPLERIGILLNYPFISCWDEEEGYLLLADCKNIT